MKYCIYGISRILLSTAIFLVIIEVPAEAQAVRADFRDSLFFTTSNNVGVETNFNFTIDTQILVGDATLHVGETTTFDYTQTYSMTTDPTVLGLTRGAPEMVPANLFPTESAPSILDRLYPKHFEHDLFAECCVRFSGLSSATLKTNSPAAGG